jgi:hypothetical protein
MLKMTNLFAIGIVGLWFLAEAWTRRGPQLRFADSKKAVGELPAAGGAAPEMVQPTHEVEPATIGRPSSARSAREYVASAALFAGSALLASFVWLAIASVRAKVGPLTLPSNAQFYTPHLPWRVILTEKRYLFSVFPPIGGYRASVLVRPDLVELQTVTIWLAVGATIFAALRISFHNRMATLGTATAIVLIVGGPAFVLASFISSHVVFPPASRYGLSALPFLILLVAALVRGRGGSRLLGGFAVVVTVLTFGNLAFS